MKADSATPAGVRGKRGARTSARAKLRKELRAFQRLRPKLLESHLNQFVAVHRGEVIATDPDEFALAARIEGTARREGPIAICKVTAEPAEPTEYPYTHLESPAVAEPEP